MKNLTSDRKPLHQLGMMSIDYKYKYLDLQLQNVQVRFTNYTHPGVKWSVNTNIETNYEQSQSSE